MLTEELKKRGVWMRVPPYILPVAPPLIITADELDGLLSDIDEVLATVENRLGMAGSR